MLRARTNNGRFILGVTAENIERLTAGQPIHVDLSDIGGHDDVFIIYATTLADVKALLEKELGPLPVPTPLPDSSELN